MKKLSILLTFAFCLAFLNACSILSSGTTATKQSGISELRPGVSWGQTPDEVRKAEKDLYELETDADMILLGPVSFFNVPDSKVAYFFHQNKLAATVYLIDNREIKPEAYFDLYFNITKELNAKYDASPEKSFNVPPGMPDTLEAATQALLNGELDYTQKWSADLTLLRLENMNGSPAITLQFSNAAMASEVRSAIQAESGAGAKITLPEGVAWDMSHQAVLKLNKNQPIHNEKHIVLYRTQTPEAIVLTAYTFVDGKLAMLDDFYILNDRKAQNYIAYYENFVANLTEKYGAASKRIVRLDGKKEPAQDLAQALQNGQIAFEAVWPPDDNTMLMLLLQYDEVEDTCMLIHKRIGLKYVNDFMIAD